MLPPSPSTFLTGVPDMEVGIGLLSVWAVVLLIQNASFTAVSRARNSGSDWYHAIASVFSNGIWWVSQTIIILSLMEIVKTASYSTWAAMTLVYVGATVTGAVVMGKLLRRFVEKGKRKVGHYADDAARIGALEEQVRALARVLNDQVELERHREAKAALRGRLERIRTADEGQQEADSEES